MKKFVKILSLSLVAVMLLAMLASCAPASDPGKAVEALKAEGYTALRDNNVIPAAFKLAGYSLDVVVTGTKTIKDKDGKKTVESVTIFYFANKEDAEKAYDKVKDEKIRSAFFSADRYLLFVYGILSIVHKTEKISAKDLKSEIGYGIIALIPKSSKENYHEKVCKNFCTGPGRRDAPGHAGFLCAGLRCR